MNEALGSPSLHKGEGELSFGDDSKIGTPMCLAASWSTGTMTRIRFSIGSTPTPTAPEPAGSQEIITTYKPCTA